MSLLEQGIPGNLARELLFSTAALYALSMFSAKPRPIVLTVGDAHPAKRHDLTSLMHGFREAPGPIRPWGTCKVAPMAWLKYVPRTEICWQSPDHIK